MRSEVDGCKLALAEEQIAPDTSKLQPMKVIRYLANIFINVFGITSPLEERPIEILDSLL